MSSEIGIKIRLVASQELKRNLAKMHRSMADILEATVASGALVLEGAAKHHAPRKTGTLSDSIHHETVIKEDIRCIVKVGTNLSYAAQKEFGGFIYPKNKRVLHWVDEEGNNIFAAWVYQGPYPYMRPAIDENRDKIVRAMALAWNDILRKALA